MADQHLTPARLRELLCYSPESGEFRWRISDRNRKAGALAGSPNERSRRVYISIDNRHYRAHRLAWLYVHGRWPEHVIDHINGDWSDNRIANLRDVPQAVNLQNLRGAKGKTRSGLLGVQANGRGQWCSLIQVAGVRHYLGNFYSAEEAHEAYLEAKRELHAGNTL